MKLDYAEIKNFRSIKYTEIHFDPACRVLVGINESGKSNILKALSFLAEEHKPDKSKDIREKLRGETEIKESYIDFILNFEKEESEELIESVSSQILANTENPNIVSVNGKSEKVKKFCTKRNKGVYRINILTEGKYPLCYSLGEDCNLITGWKKPTNLCPQGFTISLNDQEHVLTQYELVRSADLPPDIPDQYLEDAEIGDLEQIYSRTIKEITLEHLPKTLLWEYSESNFLPEDVEIEAFSQNPDSCEPLKNMFALAGIQDIKESINQARNGTTNKFINYLDSIADKTTKHFRTVWKEYGSIKFSLQLNADQIVPGIKEKNIYDFAKRSDGFKRFVTFLLMVSANVKTDKIHNTLLLIDEPETSLHPSGARYLQNELINISKKNYVVYSTHSIFMIDQSELKRHYIVKKKNEITSVEIAEESNIRDEEVLYNALGYSVFSILEERNLIFEGWRDKRLFETALKNAGYNLQQKYNDVGTCHAKGVSTIGRISTMIELAKRNCLIVSDSDEAAKNHKKAHEESKGFGRWKTYQDIDSSIEAITAEDFIKNDFIARQIKTALSGNGDKTFSFDENILAAKKDKLSEIRKWLKNHCQMNDEKMKEKITEVKNLIYKNLSPSDIEYEEYEKLLTGISFD